MKIPEIYLKGKKDPGMLDFMDYTQTILNQGRYQFRAVTEVPQWIGDEGEAVIYWSSNPDVGVLYYYLNGEWNTLGAVSGGQTFVLENRTDDPASPVIGQMWYRSDL